jgi:hypothetical protein
MHALVLNGSERKRMDFGGARPPTLSANKGAWLPIVPRGDQPVSDPDTETCEPTETVGEDAITQGWAVRDLTADELNARKAAIKAEARRRILAIFPDWKQTNMVARGVELQDAWRRNSEWSVGEAAEAAALQTAWNWIKSVRAASDALEISPPADFTNDEHWRGV